MSSLAVIIKSELPQAHVKQRVQLDESKPHEAVRALSDFLRSMAGGVFAGSVEVATGSDNPTAASGTITLESCATDSVTIGGVTFTGSGSPTGNEQFETDGDDEADAAALAAKINAHPTLSQIVEATSEDNVVTVTCRIKGVIGNFITLAETGSTITLSGTALEGGTGGATEEAVVYSVGL